MVKQTRNRNAPEGSKAPMLEEFDAFVMLENQQFEHYQVDQFEPTEK